LLRPRGPGDHRPWLTELKGRPSPEVNIPNEVDPQITHALKKLREGDEGKGCRSRGPTRATWAVAYLKHGAWSTMAACASSSTRPEKEAGTKKKAEGQEEAPRPEEQEGKAGREKRKQPEAPAAKAKKVPVASKKERRRKEEKRK